MGRFRPQPREGALPNPTLSIAAHGPEVDEGRMAVRDLALIADAFERAILRAAEVILEGRTRGRGRKPKAIEEQCRLFLVGWRSGRAVACFEVGPRNQLFSEVAEPALGAVIDGLAQIQDENGSLDRTTPPSRAALVELVRLGALFDRGIERLELMGADGIERRAVFDRRSAAILAEAVRRAPEPERLVVTGRLDRLDGHEGLAGTLWDREGRVWTCTFPPALEADLRTLWRQWVEVEGLAVPMRGRKPSGRLAVERIRPVEAPLEERGRRFWTAPTLDRLAVEQGVGPIETIEELLSVWGEERLESDPFEELMAERARRRLEASAARD